jgi:hypothetical protein
MNHVTIIKEKGRCRNDVTIKKEKGRCMQRPFSFLPVLFILEKF